MTVSVPIRRILALCDVVATPPWDDVDGLTPDLVRSCVRAGRLISDPVDAGPATAEQHAARIAWLVLNPAPDPIEIDVGGGAFRPRWIVSDGNHRLYAACIRGDSHIPASISGSYELSWALLGVYPEADQDLEDGYLRNAQGRVFELLSDGRTVWINADDGMSVGRFFRVGVDVHRDAAGQMETGEQCLACVHDLPPAEAWDVFVAAIEEHYGVRVPEAYRPDYAEARPLEGADVLPSP